MSPIRSYDDPDATAAYLARAKEAQARIDNARKTVTAADAQAASTMSANYPHMSPGTVLPLAQANVAPDDPLAQHVALQEAKSHKAKRGVWGAIGDFIGDAADVPFGIASAGVRDVLNPIGGAALAVAKPTLRYGTAALAAPLEVGAGVIRDVAAVGGNIAAGAASGAAVGAAVGAAGFNPFTVVGGAIGGAVIGGAAGGLADAEGKHITTEGAQNPLAQSALGQDLFGGKSLGQGYLPGGSAHEAAAEASRKAAAIAGHALTPGRFLAYTVTAPGSAPYNLLSGAMDAATSWELDPAQHGLHALSEARAAERSFVPTEKALARLTGADRVEAGLVDSTRKTVVGERVNEWLKSDKGQNAMKWFAANDFEDIRQVLGKNKVDIDTVMALHNAKTPEEAAQVLAPRLGLDRGLEIKPKIGGLGMKMERINPLADSRLAVDLPSGRLDYNRPTEATDQFNLLLRDANVPKDIAGQKTKEFADLMLDGSYEARRKADALLYNSFGGNSGAVAQSAGGQAMMRKLAKRAADGDDAVLQHLIGEDAMKTNSSRVSIGGATQGMPNAGTLAGLIDEGFNIDRQTVREIKAATSKYSRLLTNPKVRIAGSAADHLTNDVWKPAALLRGAWTVRVVGEEQIRMAAAGRLSLFNHPLSYMAWMVDEDSKIAQTFRKHGIDVFGKGGVDIAGERFAAKGSTTVSDTDALHADLMEDGDRFAQASGLKQQAEGWHDSEFTKAGHVETYTKGMPGHVEATAENIDQLASDPLTQMLATRPANEVKRWFMTGDGNELRQAAIAKGAPLKTEAQVDAHLANAKKQLNKVMGTVEGTPADVAALRSTPDAGPRFGGPAQGRDTGTIRQPEAPAAPPVREPYRPPGPAQVGPTGPVAYGARPAPEAPRVLPATDPTTLARSAAPAGSEAAASYGRHPGIGATGPQPLIPAQAGSPLIREAIATGELNGVAIRNARGEINKDFLKELRKIDDHLPDSITGSAAHVPNSRWEDARDKTVRTLFTNLMARPSAKLSRSPMFRQTYWDEAKNLITELEPAAQSKLLESARTARLPKGDIEALEARAAAGSGSLKVHEGDFLAKGRALDATQELLYDAARKGQLSDSLRILFPFMEAQKEVMKVWAKVGTESPQVIRRAQQVIQGARGNGTFYTDPTTGEEMFTFPFSKWATSHLIGMPVPLTGSVQGLNMFGSGIIPGIGPAVQIPAKWMLPDKPQFDALNKLIDPFGNTADSQGILESQLPGWFTKLKTALNAPESDRAFSNAVKDVWSEGVSQGRYKTDTPEDIKDGLDNAKANARWLYLIRGISSLAGAPTTPSPQFMAKDKDGKYHMAKTLAEDYRSMMNDPKVGPSMASQAFLQKYGNNASAFMQAKTYSTVVNAPSTADFSTWSRGATAGRLKDKYGEVASLFGPQGEGFDYQSYVRNIKSGATVNLTPQQFVEQTNNRIASMIYYNQKDRFGPTPSKEQRAWLSDLKGALTEKYPGYGIPLPGKPDQETVKKQYIPAIEKAVTDKSLKDNDVARAARVYLAARTQAVEAAQAAGYNTFAQSKAAAPLRDWLRSIGENLGQKVPDFAIMFDRVFDREMVSDDATGEGGTSAAPPAAAAPAQSGMVTAGNIDIHARPVAHNKDGSISTVRSITITDDQGRAILIPTVSDDGKVLSNDDAIKLYKKTGKHLGIFNSEDAADTYAQSLHEEQAQEYKGR